MYTKFKPYNDKKTLIAENRADLLDKLNYELLLDRKSWRLRSRFAEECLKLCRKRTITAEQVNHIICCFALTFMDDTINGVRIAGAELLAEIFSIFIEKEWPSMMLGNGGDSISEESILDSMPLTKALLNDARKGFLRSNSWRRRQTWANVLEFLTKNFEVSLQQYFFIFQEDILAVANDGVRNTRIKFCQIFQSLLEHREDETTMNELFPSTYSTFQKLIDKMANYDSDFEIQTQAQIILGHLNPITDYLDYDKHRDQLIEKEDKMWKNFSLLTGKYLDDRNPKFIIEDYNGYKSPSSDEV
uniref:Uncharacterized protein n=1 Tax=Panagrolaimus sp. ES5 TaxID=591445 RepID=A0AC34F1E6_9BILA